MSNIHPPLRRLLARAALALALAGGAGLAPAAGADARLLSAAQQAQAGLIADLKEMVLIESGSTHIEGLQAMAALLERKLQAAGFATERRPATTGTGADTVIGTRRGTGQRRLMLQAHMDTVFPTGTLATQPYKADAERIHGPGVADDKGGIAVILSAVKILADAGWQDYAQLTVLFNPDEEVGSRGSGDLIATLAEQHDVVLSFEPTIAKSVAKGEPLLLGTSGTAAAIMEVTGRSAHAGAAPEEGRNALYELSHQMLQTRDIAKEVPGTALQWTNAQAAQAPNQIPGKATARADVRLSRPDAHVALEQALQARVAGSRLVPDTETSVRLVLSRPPYLAGERGLALARRAQAIYAELQGRELALMPMTGGGSDAGFAARSGKPIVLESLGLAGHGFHTPGEYIEVDSIVPRLYLATRLLTELGRP